MTKYEFGLVSVSVLTATVMLAVVTEIVAFIRS